jgi:hypothetical protein
MRNRLSATLLTALCAATACSDGSKPPIEPTPAVLTVQVRGTVARDSVVRVRVAEGDTELAAGQYTLAASPDTTVQLLGGDSLRFVGTGPARLTARRGGVEAMVDVSVPVPPPLQVSLLGTMARDSVVRVLVRSAGTVLTTGITFQVAPAGAGTLLGGDSLRLVEPGPITVRATRGRDTGSVSASIAAQPPLFVMVQGRTRRGSVVRVEARRAAGGPLIGGAAVTFEPAELVQALGGDSVRLVGAGPLLVRAVAGRDTGTVTVAVEPSPQLVITAAGRALRGSVLHFRVGREGVQLPTGEAALTFTPSDAVEALGGDSVRLLRVGALQVRAATPWEVGTMGVEVAAPPPLAVTATGRAQRGSVLRIRVEREGTALPAGAAALTFDPADGAQALGGDSVRLLRVGALQVRAATAWEAGTLTVDVAAPPALAVTVTGRLERGMVVQVRTAREGATLPAGEAALTFTPADAAQALGGDSVRLLRAGALEVRAATTYEAGTRTVNVATPPSVVFDRVVNSNRDLWRVSLDGADLARLTDDTADDLDATVQGTRVVFVSYRADANAELWSMPLAGGTATRLTRTRGNEMAPALSPNGDRLAFTFDGTGLAKVWLSSADGTGGARASTLGADYALDAAPSWWPDGTRIAFMSTANGNADLFAQTPPAAPVALTTGSPVDLEPAVAPDGDRVVFASTRSGSSTTDLYLLRVSTGEITRLTTSPNGEGQAAWTADGRIVFIEFVAGVGRLRWLDPASPAVVHSIETGTGSARNPALIP